MADLAACSSVGDSTIKPKSRLRRSLFRYQTKKDSPEVDAQLLTEDDDEDLTGSHYSAVSSVPSSSSSDGDDSVDDVESIDLDTAPGTSSPVSSIMEPTGAGDTNSRPPSSEVSSISIDETEEVKANGSNNIICSVFGCLSTAEKLSPISQKILCSEHYQKDVQHLQNQVSELNKVFLSRTRSDSEYMTARNLLERRIDMLTELETEVSTSLSEVEDLIKRHREEMSTQFGDRRKMLCSDLAKLTSDGEAVISKGAQLRILMEIGSYDEAFSLLTELKPLLDSNELQMAAGLSCQAPANLKSLKSKVVTSLKKIQLVDDASLEPFNQFANKLQFHQLKSCSFNSTVHYISYYSNVSSYCHSDGYQLTAFGVVGAVQKKRSQNMQYQRALPPSGYIVNFNVHRELLLLTDEDFRSVSLIDLGRIRGITIGLPPPFTVDNKQQTIFICTSQYCTLMRTDFSGRLLLEIADVHGFNCLGLFWSPCPKRTYQGCLTVFINKQGLLGNKFIQPASFNDFSSYSYVHTYFDGSNVSHMTSSSKFASFSATPAKLGPINAVDLAASFEYCYILSANHKTISIYGSRKLNLIKTIGLVSDTLLTEVEIDPRGLLFVQNVSGSVMCCNLHKDGITVATIPPISKHTADDTRFHSFRRLLFYETDNLGYYLLNADNSGQKFYLYSLG